MADGVSAGVFREEEGGRGASGVRGREPVGGREPTVGERGAAVGDFNCEVGTRSEPEAGHGAVPGREVGSPVDRRSMAVGGRTGPVGVLAGGTEGDRVTLAGGKADPGEGLAAGSGVVGGRSEVVGGRAEPVGGGGLIVRRIEPVAGRLEGRGGAKGGVVEAGVPVPAGGGSPPERGCTVTRGTPGDVDESGVGGVGRGEGGGASSGMAEKG